jgi:chromosome segregation ATPase
MTRRLAARTSVAAVAVAAALAVAGCGGEETTSTTEWADGVCSAIVKWKDSVSSATQQLKGGNLSKETLQSTAGDVEDATKTLSDDLKDLGKPDTESGQKAKDAVQQLSEEVDQSRETIEQAVDGATDAASTLNAVSVAGSTLGSLLTELGNAVDNLSQLDPSGELRDAFAQADSCQSLSS